MVATRLANLNLNLLDLHVIRGLEFDAVVVVDPDAILAQRADGGVGALYTALTATSSPRAPGSVNCVGIHRDTGNPDTYAKW